MFTLTNSPSGNAVAVFERHSDGSLTQTASYSTGGLSISEFAVKGDELSLATTFDSNGVTPISIAVSSPSAGATPFGFAFDSLGRAFVSEAAGSASSYSVDTAGVHVITAAGATQEAAPCWVVVTPEAISSDGAAFYVLAPLFSHDRPAWRTSSAPSRSSASRTSGSRRSSTGSRAPAPRSCTRRPE